MKKLGELCPCMAEKLCRFREKLDKGKYLGTLDLIWPWQLWRFCEKGKKDLTMKTVTELANRFPETENQKLNY